VKSVAAILWFVVLILLMHALRDIYGPLLKRRLVKLAVAPGIVVFLFFKILTCYVAGARIREIKPFDDKVELLQYDKPSLGAFGEFLIGVLPMACLLLTFALVFTFVPAGGTVATGRLPDLSLLWQSPGLFFSGGWHFLKTFFTSAFYAIAQISFWLLVYAAVNTLLAGAPSFRDLKYLAIACGIAILALLAFEALHVRVGSLEVRSFLYRLKMSFNFLLGAGIGWVLLSIFTVGAWRLFAQNRSERKS
jgi:hypothetical protein